MRRSEVLGLSWANVEFQNKMIRIKQVLVSKPGEGTIIKKTTKTDSSRKSVTFTCNSNYAKRNCEEI